jgi:hypothetical protein
VHVGFEIRTGRRGHETCCSNRQFSHHRSSALADHDLDGPDLAGGRTLCGDPANKSLLELRKHGNRQATAISDPLEGQVRHRDEVQDLSHRDVGRTLIVGGQDGPEWLIRAFERGGALRSALHHYRGLNYIHNVTLLSVD